MSPRGKKQNQQMRGEALAKITQAALKVFADYGYHGATMKRIAKATGLSYGLVYHYFPSKAVVFRRLVEMALGGSLEALRQFMRAPGSAWQKIEAYSVMVVKSLFEGETSLYFVIMLQAMTQGKAIPGLPAYLAGMFSSYYEIFVPVITEAQRAGAAVPGDPEALAGAYFSFVQGLATIVLQHNGLEKKITPDMLAHILRRTEPGS
jgi:AcrR family transcriptional regulator